MAFFTAAQLRTWANPTMDAKADTVLATCIAAATDWLEEETGRTLATRAVTGLYLNGDDAYSYGSNYEVLVVPVSFRPVVYPTGFTVKEDGTQLTTGVGNDTSKGVILRNANSENRLLLLRSSWSRGTQNVELAFTAGYADGACPARVSLALMEIAWMFYTAPTWLGKSHASGSGHGVTFEKELTPMTQATIESLRQGMEGC